MGRASARKQTLKVVEPVPPLKLDLGCGPHKREGFHGVDSFQFVGVDTVHDLRQAPWPWADNSVSEAHASHFVEHLTALERVQFCNELHRVLVPNGTCQIIVPHWASNRAYGDFTHQWPPVSEMWFYYLSKDWRLANAPHTDISVHPAGLMCHFEATWGYSMRPDLLVRNSEYQQSALQNWKEAAMDTIANLKALK
jgi:hypothetical protein